MIQHAIACLPLECCGVFSGRNDHLLSVYRINNLDYRKHRYSMDLDQLNLIISKIKHSSEEVLGFYHSHTDTNSYPSKKDVELAIWPSVYHLIISLSEPIKPIIQAYKISDLNVSESEIIVN